MAKSCWMQTPPPCRVNGIESILFTVYKDVDSKVSFPRLEEEILDFWEKNRIFRKSVENRKNGKEFVFYDGPPFATGLPHFGHFVPGTIKDIFPRYAAMKGFRAERRFGWDCHGLPVEYEMEKELGISGKSQIEKFGVDRFNEACRSIVLRYTGEWQKIMTRSGRWVDFDRDYKTMDPAYMESIWWIFKSLWDKNLIYKGYYILPNCPRCSTPLSNHELNLGGYRNVNDPAITVRFKAVEDEKTWFLAWTTTPWTLVSNLGLTLGDDIDYVKVENPDSGDFYILAEALLGNYFPNPSALNVVWKRQGSSLKGLSYEPLFPYFSDRSSQGAFRTFTGNHVTTENGTGIVHTAPGFGEEDYEVMKESGVSLVCPVDEEGCYTAEVSDYSGRFVKDCDKDIIARLKSDGFLVKRDQILHPYPHCWRCESPLIYKAVVSWFLNVQKIKENMIDANGKVYWVPEHLKEGRFGNWLKNARDWAISRNRYWGNPLPIWECGECGKQECIGGREELNSKIDLKMAEEHRKAGGDLHKHHIDNLVWTCSCGGTMKRIPEVLDCWFESGAMPYAQVHYPFENKQWFENHFPADFIAEGLDQTRGWFYTLSIIGVALFNTLPFKHVVVNGLVLAEDGKKMSKSLRNYTNPEEVINEFGADALRLFLMNSSVVKAEGLRYSDGGVRDMLRSVLLPLWNAYSFYVTYANIDGIKPEKTPKNPENLLDKWILSEIGRLIVRVDEGLALYDIQKAIEPILEFIESLNNWYIRRSKRRFWKSLKEGLDKDKEEAYATLRIALLSLTKVAAPIIPFITETIYQNLRGNTEPESVHLCDWPDANPFSRDEELERRMNVTRRAVSLGRALRNAHDLKIRQPLKAFYIVTRDEKESEILRQTSELLAEELNMKNVYVQKNESELVEYSVKANFKVLGRRLGKDMKMAAERIATLDSDEIRQIVEGFEITVELNGENTHELKLNAETVEIRRTEKSELKVLNEGSLTVALDMELTPELLSEGLIRDLIRGIQNLRKEFGLEVTDRVDLILDGPKDVQSAALELEKYLKGETLSDSICWEDIVREEKGQASVVAGPHTVRVKIAASRRG